jgi:hypothetical protein
MVWAVGISAGMAVAPNDFRFPHARGFAAIMDFGIVDDDWRGVSSRQ